MSISFNNTVFSAMISNFSKTISRTPRTKSTSNLSGEESFTTSSAENITGAFFRKEDAYTQDQYGLLQGADAVLMVEPSTTINKNDLLTFDSENYNVQKITTRKLGTTSFYKVARCYKNG